MTRLSIALLFCCIMDLGTQAQVISDSLQVKAGKLAYGIYQGPMQVGDTRIRALMKDCNEGLSMYQSGKKMESIGWLFAACGVVLTAAGVGNHYFNPQAGNPITLIVPGVAISAFGIGVALSGKKRVYAGVLYYNQHCID